ncbi:MAG TPA: hypothetical protein VGI34_03960 [Candidatus Acidoferrales bacterium]
MAPWVMLPSNLRTRLQVFAGVALIFLGAVVWPNSSAAAKNPLRKMQPPAQQTSGTESPLPVFEFHSGFWVNLHHFLYLQARLSAGNPSSTDNGRGQAPPDEHLASLIDFPAMDIEAWNDAVAFYAKDLARRDLSLNGDMQNINDRLADMEACPDLDGKSSPFCKSGLRPELIEALQRAGPVYRAHWWPEHDRANREWIAQVSPLVRHMGVELSVQLADIYQRSWPSNRLRVDVVWYGGPYGAYTSLSPTHVTISSHDPRNRGVYGFEVLFHESSHALSGSVSEAIAREFRERDKPIPRDLWHALLFYTTGEIVRRDVLYGSISTADLRNRDSQNQNNDPQDADFSAYQTYASRFGLYSGSWVRFRGMLDLYWLPYLDGKISFDTAIARLAAAM